MLDQLHDHISILTRIANECIENLLFVNVLLVETADEEDRMHMNVDEGEYGLSIFEIENGQHEQQQGQANTNVKQEQSATFVFHLSRAQLIIGILYQLFTVVSIRTIVTLYVTQIADVIVILC